ncbi:hypothetical protein TCDM_11357 [Trypanosoma cruzi Dm28c]|uniref:Uncharacterized protein n=1 Tax=Trypanosoma cruzi Dm28c TaxID=1416333 RepID=V5D0W5_TRYCR|nr:hypothetical protein TCDM_11357 [Trypanosoma cruzi Dm28c]
MHRGITGLGSRGHQAVSHGPLAALRTSARGRLPPICGALQLGAGCRCNTLGLLHSVLPDSCGNVTAAARTVPRCTSNHVTIARGVTHAVVEASQSASRRTMAKRFRRGTMPACRERPSSLLARAAADKILCVRAFSAF